MFTPEPQPPRRRHALIFFDAAVAVVVAYILGAWLVLPLVCRHYEYFPQLEHLPKRTVTASGQPGDPINLALIGSELETLKALSDAGWQEADTDRRAARGEALLLFARRPDHLWSRPGTNPQEWNELLLWRAPTATMVGRDLWLAAVARRSPAPAGRAASGNGWLLKPAIDEARDQVIQDLLGAGQVASYCEVTGVGPLLKGRGAEGQRFYTDGEMVVAVIAPDNVPPPLAPRMQPNPARVRVKDQLWDWLERFFTSAG